MSAAFEAAGADVGASLLPALVRSGALLDVATAALGDGAGWEEVDCASGAWEDAAMSSNREVAASSLRIRVVSGLSMDSDGTDTGEEVTVLKRRDVPSIARSTCTRGRQGGSQVGGGYSTS